MKFEDNKKEITMAKRIVFLIAVICAIGLLFWAVKQYIKLPVVKFSVSQNKVVAVENFRGETLPLYPLPEKYEKVYVQ